MKVNNDMQLTLGQKFKEVVADITSCIFPDKRPSISYVVQNVTGNATFRKIETEHRDNVLDALKTNGYKDAEEALEAFETAAGLVFSKNVPR